MDIRETYYTEGELDTLKQIKTKNEIIELLLIMYEEAEQAVIMEYSGSIDEDFDRMKEFITAIKEKLKEMESEA